ncbi:MAG: hypothetical protein HLUCCO07_10455 [Rhodobacteraceae bacterium HLUCCO07]|nr:MAG: hypothetical protein HLUCCO07_10455 [Rhodobacteraceae bacterium HLUCCO07]
MRALTIMGLVTVLAGCGADGEPETPTRDAGLTVSGSASMGWVRGPSDMGRRF